MDRGNVHAYIKPFVFIILVDPVVQSLIEGSVILDGNIEQAEQLAKWVEDKTCRSGWKLCYRASVDGWIGQDFHKKCDDVGPTLTLVKCGTNIFGGFTDQSWKNKSGIFNSLFFMHSNYGA